MHFHILMWNVFAEHRISKKINSSWEILELDTYMGSIIEALRNLTLKFKVADESC